MYHPTAGRGAGWAVPPEPPHQLNDGELWSRNGATAFSSAVAPPGGWAESTTLYFPSSPHSSAGGAPPAPPWNRSTATVSPIVVFGGRGHSAPPWSDSASVQSQQLVRGPPRATAHLQAPQISTPRGPPQSPRQQRPPPPSPPQRRPAPLAVQPLQEQQQQQPQQAPLWTPCHAAGSGRQFATATPAECALSERSMPVPAAVTRHAQVREVSHMKLKPRAGGDWSAMVAGQPASPGKGGAGQRSEAGSHSDAHSAHSVDSLEAAHDEEVKRFAKFQAIDFWEPCNPETRAYARRTHGRFAACKWLLFACIGIGVGCCAVLMKQSIEYGIGQRLRYVEDIMYESAPECVKGGGGAAHGRRLQALAAGEPERRGQALSSAGPRYMAVNCTPEEMTWMPPKRAKIKAALFWVGSSMGLIMLGAALPVFLNPAAAGSGLPQVMAYLNGISMPRILEPSVLGVKFVSCLLSVSSGLPVGPEGPMVHMGAICGNLMTQAHHLTDWMGKRKATGVLHYIDEAMDHFGKMQEQRDFITCGAAAGVAAAFGAPVGGLLFVMEEIASSWSPALTWRIFFATTCAFFVVSLFNSMVHAWEKTGNQFGAFSENAQILFQPEIVLSRIDMNLFIIVPSAILGLICGGLAVFFTKINLTVFRWRKRRVMPHRWLRVLEPMLIALVYGILTFVVPIVVTEVSGCDPVPSPQSGGSGSGSGSAGGSAAVPARRAAGLSVDTSTGECGTSVSATANFVYFMCGSDAINGNYSTMATLAFNGGETIVKHLLSMGTPGQYTPGSLGIFLVLYSTFASYSAGSAFATGLVIPFLVIGSVTGRLYAEVIDKVWGTMGSYEWFDPGVFALMGAGAFFGGVSRLTVSLAVIMLEISNQLFFLPPMMLSILVAKWVADRYAKEALYHGLIHELDMPHLDPMGDQSSALLGRTAKHLMTHPVVVLRENEERGRIDDALSTSHGAFPVIDSSGRLRGILLSSQLEKLEPGDDPSQIVPLAHIMSSSPFAVHHNFQAKLTYMQFQTVGMRHLIVTDDHLQVVGIITRKDLAAALHHADLHDEEADIFGDLAGLTKGAVQATQLVTKGAVQATQLVTKGVVGGAVGAAQAMAKEAAHLGNVASAETGHMLRHVTRVVDSPKFLRRATLGAAEHAEPNPAGGRDDPLLGQQPRAWQG
eukprot:TRINITY_DN2177_c3_g1_i1.p1 TRINITY_DN2177_c3_g1~~TRINITY_DN2177_c3_g1_i1.p1  ORF type:complete len:1168 (+),score=358.51 TRINITY_DN2177_c3_g1_i1:82-3585(+)